MQKDDYKKSAELYKQALKQDPYNESIRKNYEIAMLKEKEKEQQKNQKNDSGAGGGDQEKDKKQGDDQGDQAKTTGGTGQKNKGEGDGEDPNENKTSNPNSMPKDVEDAILNRVGNKERETAKRILNKNSYSMPESNEKDW